MKSKIGFFKKEYAIAFLLPIFLLVFSARVNAEGNVHMGSIQYNVNVNSDFNVGIYTEGVDGDRMSKYEVVISYDPVYISYESDTDKDNDGKITLKGESLDGGTVRNMLTFHSVLGGESKIIVESAKIYDLNGNLLDNKELPTVNVNITADASEPPTKIKINGEEVADYSADVREYSVTVPFSEKLNIEVPGDYLVIPDTDKLSVGKNEVKVIIAKEGATAREYKFEITVEPKEEPKEETEVTDNTSKENGSKDAQNASAGKTDGTGKDGKIGTGKETKGIEDKEFPNLEPIPDTFGVDKESLKAQNRKSIIILIGFAVIIVLILAAKFGYDAILSRGNRIKRDRTATSSLRKNSQSQLLFVDINDKSQKSQAQYFEYGLDIKMKDINDKAENKES